MQLDEMDWQDFEDLVFELVSEMGFEAEATSRSADQGIDIVAHNKQALLEGEYVIQCKRYGSPVGEPKLRDLYGVVSSRNANKGILITNSTFTRNAIEFAKDKEIELINGNKLQELISEHLGEQRGEVEISGNETEVNRILASAMKTEWDQIKERVEKVKEGRVFLDGKTYKTDEGYLNFLRGKADRFDDMLEVYTSQLAFDDDTTQDSDDSNYDRNEIISRVEDAFETLRAFLKDWEEVKGVNPPREFSDLHELFQSKYTQVFDAIAYNVQVLDHYLKAPGEAVDEYDEIKEGDDGSVQFEFGQETIDFDDVGRELKRAQGNCFVVTAVYQSSQAEQVKILRQWRDDVLSTYLAGRFLIWLYYRIGPGLAQVVHKCPSLRSPLEKFIDVITSSIDCPEEDSAE